MNNFVTPVLDRETCIQLVMQCGDHLRPATVRIEGRHQVAPEYRDAGMMFLDELPHDLFAGPIARIQAAIAQFTGLPIENQERLQFCQYGPGQGYTWHQDDAGHFPAEVGGRRVWSIVLYLNEDFVGGNTEFVQPFPLQKYDAPGLELDPPVAIDVQRHPAVDMVQSFRGLVGEMFGWENEGPVTTHQAAEVIEGMKAVLLCWVRENKYDAERDGHTD